MKRIYLDYAASTPVLPEVLDSMRPYWSENFANAHASHEDGRIARDAVEKSRDIISRAISALPA